jgi:hypothetical protein
VALGSTQSLREISTRNLPGLKGRPENKPGNFTAICEPIFYKIWEPRHLTTLWAFTACYRDNFIFLYVSLHLAAAYGKIINFAIKSLPKILCMYIQKGLQEWDMIVIKKFWITIGTNCRGPTNFMNKLRSRKRMNEQSFVSMRRIYSLCNVNILMCTCAVYNVNETVHDWLFVLIIGGRWL